ncbi:MAG: PrsW family intramembrane metalloprotease [Myxococcota bacterium]
MSQIVVYILVFFSVFAAILPMVAFVAVIWWLDRYDREPVWMVLLTFLWGALGGAGLSLFGNTLLHLLINAVLGPESAEWMGPVLVAPLIEEPTKAVILLLVATSRYFDNTTDGFVYGAAAGLGFGMTENMLYFYQSAQIAGFDLNHGIMSWGGTVVIRTFFSAVMHATASSIIGAFIGWSRFRGLFLKFLSIPVGVVLAMGIHALWNGLLVLGGQIADEALMFYVNLALLPLEVLLVFGVFQLSLLAEKRTLLRELTEEAEHGVLPLKHVEPLSSYLGRNATAFLPAPKLQDHYIRTVTTLAFRKHQARHAPEHRAGFYADEIERLRREVRGLLQNTDQ